MQSLEIIERSPLHPLPSCPNGSILHKYNAILQEEFTWHSDFTWLTCTHLHVYLVLCNFITCRFLRAPPQWRHRAAPSQGSLVLPFNLLSISFHLVACFLIIEFWDSFICFEYKSFIRYMVYKYFLQCVSSFHLLTASFEDRSFKFWWSPSYQFLILWILLFLPYFRNLCLIQDHKDFLLYFPEVL